ncbi:MAG: tail fiber domain-containing protein [Candidatus Omnitrophica bacterium]|nr:tail fiber domain-containing protein [Candidatus Omnitrophota bacterium]
MKRILVFSLFFVGLFVIIAYAQTVRFSTYYPAPFGVYDELRLQPKPAIATTGCQDGTMYYNSSIPSLMVCNNASYGILSGKWTENESVTPNLLYPNDVNNKVIIGATSPISVGGVLEVQMGNGDAVGLKVNGADNNSNTTHGIWNVNNGHVSNTSVNYGLYSSASTASSTTYGLYGYALGAPTNYSLFGTIGSHNPASQTSYAVFGQAAGFTSQQNAYAGFFNGDVHTAGGLSVGALNATTAGIHIDLNNDGPYGLRTEVNNTSDPGTNVYGVFSRISGRGDASAENYGMAAVSNITNADSTGLYAVASGSNSSHTNIGLRAAASGGNVNWSGYFANGNMYIEDRVGIGVSTFPNGATLEIATPSTGEFRAVDVTKTLRNTNSDQYGIVSLITGSNNRSGGSFALIGSSVATNGSAAGVYGVAGGLNPDPNYGVIGIAQNSIAKNWAGYFPMGDVYIGSKIGIGTSTMYASTQLHAYATTGYLSLFQQTGTAGGDHGIVISQGMGSTPGVAVVDSALYIDAVNYAIYQATGTNAFWGDVAIGQGGTSGHKLLVTGGTTANDSGVWVALSDRRLKTDIGPLDNALEKILQLQGVRFKWKKPEQHGGRDKNYMGLVAQDVQQVIPEWVREDKEGFLNLEPIGDTALLIEAIKELNEKVENLREENRLLRKEVDSIKNGL